MSLESSFLSMLTYPKCLFFCWWEASCRWQWKALSQTLQVNDSSVHNRRYRVKEENEQKKKRFIKRDKTSSISFSLINHRGVNWLWKLIQLIDGTKWKLFGESRKAPTSPSFASLPFSGRWCLLSFRKKAEISLRLGKTFSLWIIDFLLGHSQLERGEGLPAVRSESFKLLLSFSPYPKG